MKTKPGYVPYTNPKNQSQVTADLKASSGDIWNNQGKILSISETDFEDAWNNYFTDYIVARSPGQGAPVQDDSGARKFAQTALSAYDIPSASTLPDYWKVVAADQYPTALNESNYDAKAFAAAGSNDTLFGLNGNQALALATTLVTTGATLMTGGLSRFGNSKIKSTIDNLLGADSSETVSESASENTASDDESNVIKLRTARAKDDEESNSAKDDEGDNNSAKNKLASTAGATSVLGFLSDLFSAQLWDRILFVLGGVALVIIGLVLMLHKQVNAVPIPV